MKHINSWTGTPGSGVVVTSPGFGSAGDSRHPIWLVLRYLSVYFDVKEDEVRRAYTDEELLKEWEVLHLSH